MVARTLALAFVPLAMMTLPALSAADTVTATGLLKQVDTKNRKIVVARKTSSGSKTGEFVLADDARISLDGQPAPLESLAAGQTATLDYDTTIQKVVKVSALPRQFLSLFDGRSLSGWQPNIGTALRGCTAENGVLRLSSAARGQLVTKRQFNDFVLSLDFFLAKGANSGVYLRGRYELQLLDESGQKVKPGQRCGAIYNLIVPTAYPYRGPNQWNTLEVILIGRTVTVMMNGVTIIDAQHIPQPTAGAIDANERLPGPISLQGHRTEARFRNIQIIPLD